jgi:HK97 family phage major capsid protein
MHETKIAELKQERAGLFQEMRAVIDGAEAENRDLTSEEAQEYDRMEGAFDSLDKRIARLEEQRERDRQLAGSGDPENRDFDPRETGGDNPSNDERAAEYRKVFHRYMRVGMAELTSEERSILRTGYAEMRDQAKGTGSAGGFLVPVEFERQLQEHKLQAGAMRQLETTKIVTESGEDLQVPKTTAHGQAVLIGENTQLSSADESFGQVTLKAYIYARLIKVPIGLIEDNAVDLDGYLARELGRSIGALQNQHFVVGDDDNKPNGVITAAQVAKTGLTGQTSSIIYDDLVDLIYGVAPPYRREGQFLASDGILKAIRKLKDQDQRPLWEPSLQAGEPDRILGYPTFNDPDVPAPAANAKSLAFGDFSTYWIRDVRGLVVRRLEERFADSLQVGYLAWMRADGEQIDTTGAVKAYRHSAT